MAPRWHFFTNALPEIENSEQLHKPVAKFAETKPDREMALTSTIWPGARDDLNLTPRGDQYRGSPPGKSWCLQVMHDWRLP